MATELEAKMRVESHAAVREALQHAGAASHGTTWETNTFLDTPAAELKKSGKGLRIRRNHKEQGSDSLVVTYKGPKQKAAFKTREELEVTVDDEQAFLTIAGHLGYQVTLTFEKKRESWQLDGCKVELDTLPNIGTFVEIEGENEDLVRSVQEKLGLGRLAQEGESYASMVNAWLKAHQPDARELRFE